MAMASGSGFTSIAERWAAEPLSRIAIYISFDDIFFGRILKPIKFAASLKDLPIIAHVAELVDALG